MSGPVEPARRRRTPVGPPPAPEPPTPAEVLETVRTALELLATMHAPSAFGALCRACMTEHPCETRETVDEALEALR